MSVRNRHLVIPDTQVAPDCNLDYLFHIGKCILDLRPNYVIHLGDHADMPSLCGYDDGKKRMEGQRVMEDIEAAREGMEALTHALVAYNRRRLKAKKKQWWPEMHITLGNHENRINRHVEANPKLEGFLSIHDLQYESFGFIQHDFLEVIEIDGIRYSHFFPRGPRGVVTQSRNGAPSARIQVAREHQSCTAGHQQGLDWECIPTSNKILYGLIAGSCYPHDFDYLTPQGDTYWRGIIVKNDVHDGEYCPMMLDLPYLARKYGTNRRLTK